jgi:adenylosuccinate lyase
MIPRYSHPTVADVHSAAEIYGQWLDVERAVLYHQRAIGHLPASKTEATMRALSELQIDDEAVAQIEAVEAVTHHDVAAFLQWIRAHVPDGQWVHFGLTSSDVVDTAMGMRFQRLHRPLLMELGSLTSALAQMTQQTQPMTGLTHGQPAEPTSLRARAWHWLAYVETPIVELSKLTRRMQICKLSGPVGTYAHNPSEIEVRVAMDLELIPMGPGASQIVPRSTLSLWAGAAATLLSAYSKIATDLRLLAMRGEAFWPRAETHVASSAMAHKNNPIEAEQMVGFAQMARGFAAMLAPLDLWLERDISHSSVERVAVPDLWHLVFTATRRMTSMLEAVHFRPEIIGYGIEQDSNALWTHQHTLDAIRDGMGYTEARDFATNFDTETYDAVGDAVRFMDNYPATTK